MGTTYYIDRKIDLYGVYECSRCKSMELLQFRMLATGASTMSQKKASEVTEEPCRNLLNALQNFRNKPFLLAKKYSGRKLTNGYEVGFENGSHRCPFCGNLEVWQQDEYFVDACKKDPETGVPVVPDCPDASRMLVFPSDDSAVEAMRDLLVLRKQQYQEHWAARPEEARRVKEQMALLKNRIADLQPLKDAARKESNRLYALIQEKEAQLKRLSLFSTDKKTVKAELKELNIRYSAQRDADIQEERRIVKAMDAFEEQLKELKIANPGIQDELEQFRGDNEYVHIAAHLS